MAARDVVRSNTGCRNLAVGEGPTFPDLPVAIASFCLQVAA